MTRQLSIFRVPVYDLTLWALWIAYRETAFRCGVGSLAALCARRAVSKYIRGTVLS